MTIKPFAAISKVFNGMSYGLSQCGYDIRIDQQVTLYPISLKTLVLRALGFQRPSFLLASSIEYFEIPDFMCALVKDKSSFARQGVFVQNTVFEPGWKGTPTLELSNDSDKIVVIPKGSPIAQVVFYDLNSACENAYEGKYQNQQSGPQPAIFLRDTE